MSHVTHLQHTCWAWAYFILRGSILALIVKRCRSSPDILRHRYECALLRDSAHEDVSSWCCAPSGGRGPQGEGTSLHEICAKFEKFHFFVSYANFWLGMDLNLELIELKLAALDSPWKVGWQYYHSKRALTACCSLKPDFALQSLEMDLKWTTTLEWMFESFQNCDSVHQRNKLVRNLRILTTTEQYIVLNSCLPTACTWAL